MKYISDPLDFFVMSDYNFSLAGAIFWFFLVLFIHIRLKKTVLDNYIDPLVLSFLFIACIGFVGAFLWGQVYGNQTTLFWLWITYSNSFSNVPYQVPVFPLPIVYAIFTFILFSTLYTLSMYVSLRWLLWYLGMILFACMILIFDFFSGKFDIIREATIIYADKVTLVNQVINWASPSDAIYQSRHVFSWITMMQLFSIVMIVVAGYYLYQLYQHQKSSYKTIIWKEFKS